MFFLTKRLFFIFLLPVLLSSFAYYLHYHTAPTFQTDVLRRITQEARAKFPPDNTHLTLNRTIEYITSELHKSYPNHIHPNHEWVTNLAGGFKTSMLILHASLTEYVMIWGSQVDTTGHSGRNFAEFHDFLISGEGKWWKEGGLAVQVATPLNTNSYMYTDYFQGGVVQLRGGTWMLEHCHGVIPALLPFGLGDSIFSSMDPVTIFKSLKAYGGLVIKEIIQNGKI